MDGVAKKFERKNFFPDEAGVSEYLLARTTPTSLSLGVLRILIRDGVRATSEGPKSLFLVDGVVALPPDVESKSKRPSVFPSR